MTDLTNYRVTDGIDDVLAVQYNRVIDATVRAELSNIESLAANKTLVDADYPLQVLTPTAARDVTLPAVAATNHPFYIINASATYALTVKNAGGSTIGIVALSSSGSFASDAVAWHSFGGGGLPSPGTSGNVLMSNGSIWTSTSVSGPAGYMRNGLLAVSVATNDLTVALKTLAGTDPSATNAVIVRIGNVDHAITSALSVTALDGTNWCNAGGAELGGQEIDYFAYLGYNATDGVVIGFSRVPYINEWGEFSATTTNEKYGKISTTTNAAATDDYTVVGRFAATLTLGAGYTWAVPVFTPINLVQRPIFNTRQLQYTAVFTNYTVGNGTGPTAFYQITNDVVSADVAATLGSTSAIAGDITTTPVIGVGASFAALTLGFLKVVDASPSTRYAGVVAYAGGSVFLRVQALSGSYLAQVAISSAIPMTWTTSDQILLNYQYRIR